MHFVMRYDAWAVIAVFFTSVFYAINYLVKTRLACLYNEVGLSRISLDLSLAVVVFPGVLLRFFAVNVTTLFWLSYSAAGLTLVCVAGLWNVWVIYRVNQSGYWARMQARWDRRHPVRTEPERLPDQPASPVD